MPTWDAARYLQFSDLRLRPALDLITRITHPAPKTVWDLGCGAGGPTVVLKERWPEASIHGLDSSPDMLQRAEQISGISWHAGDIADWEPSEPVDVIFSNAALHWFDDHEALLGRLMSLLSPGGVLAVQMPRNHSEPSHQVIYATARSPRWSDRVAHLVRETPVGEPAWYDEILRSLASQVDVWETVYQHHLTGEDAVAAFTRGSAVRPFLDELGPDGNAFFADYASRLRPHYPAGGDGITLFGFRRLFFVATA